MAGASRILSREQVTRLQIWLNERFEAALPIDGRMGPQTAAAASAALASASASSQPAEMIQLITAAAKQAPALGAGDQAEARPPRAWLLYAPGSDEETDWTRAIQPGSTLFWTHGTAQNGGAYRLQIRSGDSIVLLVGTRVIADGIFLADDAHRFIDRNSRIRRPVRVLDRYSVPIDRQRIEREAEVKLAPHQGGVLPLAPAALALINRQLEDSGRSKLPYSLAELNRVVAARPLLDDLVAQDDILPDATTARRIDWTGPIWEPAGADSGEPDADGSRSGTGASRGPDVTADPTDASDDPVAGAKQSGQQQSEQPSKIVDPKEWEKLADIDARIPFVLDAPADTEDELERGPFALFLAQRLHLIWCQLNGEAPGLEGERSRPNPADSDTFIVHVDSPWGGGKTTFANFVARVLDPRGEQLTPGHFLRSSLAPTASPDALSSIPLDEIFVPPYARANKSDWKCARRPWIIARYNAWRDQYVQPPWWQVFLSIESAISAELRRDTREAFSAILRNPSGLGSAFAALHGRATIFIERYRYQLLNSRLKAQLLLWGLTIALLALAWQAGAFTMLLDAARNEKGATDASKISAWVTIVIALLGIGGGGLATLFTAASQSLMPDLEFTAEHKQIGVRDPISRFRRAFHSILRVSRRPVLLIVDDLDRCDPRTVVEIMRGFQTIVRSPRLFVLLLGDRAWIEAAHDIHHKDLGWMTGAEGTLGSLFVQKVIQLSFRLPTMKEDTRIRYARSVLGHIEDTPAKEGLTQMLQQVELSIQEIVEGEGSVGGKEAQAAAIIEKAAAELSGDLLPEEKAEALAVAESLASVKFVAAAGADAAQQRSIFNTVVRLTSSLPNNPRQIKRIFMAFAIYEAVGRAYFGYQLTPSGADGERRARRWRQLAMWVALAVEWPETWRAIARAPRLLQAAQLGGAERARAERALLAGKDEAERLVLQAALHRLRADPSLRALVRRTGNDPGEAFAETELEEDAVYEFNHIIWEPGFRLSAEPVEDRARAKRRGPRAGNAASAGETAP